MTPCGTAGGFATVSSTAALEAMAMDRPTLINLVFQGSGCPGTLDDLRRGRLFQPDPDWLEPTTSIVLSRSMEEIGALVLAMGTRCNCSGSPRGLLRPPRFSLSITKATPATSSVSG
jgi:hypothetical protein